MNKTTVIMASLIILGVISCESEKKKKRPNNSYGYSTDQKIELAQDSKSKQIKKPSFPAISAQANIEVKTIELNECWGYEIYKDSTLLIQQKNIPAVQGNHGFKSEKQANDVGNFVANKIKSGVFPPTISKEELNRLGVEVNKKEAE